LCDRSQRVWQVGKQRISAWFPAFQAASAAGSPV